MVSDLSWRDGCVARLFFFLSFFKFFFLFLFNGGGCIALAIIMIWGVSSFFMEGGCSFVSCLLSSSPLGGRLLHVGLFFSRDFRHF